MSIKDLFTKGENYKLFSSDPSELRKDGESLDNISETFKNRNRFIPEVDFSKPENFARYGSAEKYYEDGITRIYENYPYDGSSAEKQTFLNESTYIDLWLMEKKYPRTNGYINHGLTEGYIGTTGTTVAWASTNTNEYIHMVGGPHTASEGMIGKRFEETFEESNVYDTDIYDDVGYTGKGTRESNLKCDPDSGITVEFWLKKPTWAEALPTAGAPPLGESIFDLSGTNDGRFNVSITADDTNVRFNCLYRAESVSNSYIPTVTALISTGSWNHVAVSYVNSGSVAEWKLYLNGTLASGSTTTNQPVEITGSLHANIGALIAHYPGESGTVLGSGKLTGSLDEFRYWKTQRTSEEIGRNWFTQVYGGTNTDISNTTLGIYYKFNEGISGINSIDSTTLDYSGRVSNGSWIGYTSPAREAGSAIVESGVETSEFKDPIIYSVNPLVQAVLTEMKNSGSVYDYTNNSSFYNSFPNWVIDGDNDSNGDLKKLTQAMSSYFDTLHLQIEQLPKLKDISYFSGSHLKENPFIDSVIEGAGFVAPEVFIDAPLINQIFNKSDTEVFEEDLAQIKNLIYSNIYNNLLYIYKSKGTEKSFRNLIRCYGVGDNLINLNLYANNTTYELQDNYTFTSTKKRYTDFYLPQHFGSTIYQQTASGNPDSTSFITASNSALEDYTAFTAEIDVIFPTKKKYYQEDYFTTPFNTASIFGFHTVNSGSPDSFTWPSIDYDLSIYAIRPENNDNLTDAYFMLTSSYFGIKLTTDTFKDVYQNNKWNFAVRLAPEKVHANLVSGTANTNYKLEFYGINSMVDVVREEFTLTTSSVSSVGLQNYLNKSKRIYAGSHRQNFTGSILYKTDIRVGSLRYWLDYLDNGTIKSHAQDPNNFGVKYPHENAYNFATSLTGTEIPKIETLALYWNFDEIKTSDTVGGYTLQDLSSGSLQTIDRYSWMGNVVNRQHTGRGDFYPASTTIVNAEYIPTALAQNPEILNPTYATIRIIPPTAEEEVFTRTKRPVNYYYMIEKSMYNTITQEMLNYFASIVAFSNLIGEPTNRYRGRYKDMEYLRQIFFENVENSPDIEKYINYYKWIDTSLSAMLMELIPASSEVSDGIRTMIESHVLERNKYRNKLPLFGIQMFDYTAATLGVNVALNTWRLNHTSLPSSPPPANEHCFWWKNRADRTNPVISSGDAGVDADRNAILAASLSVLNRSYSTPVAFSVKREEIYGSNVKSNNKITNYIKSSIEFGSSDGYLIEESKVKDFLDCQDIIYPIEKQKWSFEGQNQVKSGDYQTTEGDLTAPFVAISSSVTTGYNTVLETGFKPGFGIENLHLDGYGQGDAPLQGPFTEKYVGGHQYRHVPLNQGADNDTNRPEGWSLQFQTSPTALKVIYQPVTLPRATFYRDLIAKRPINIRNIKNNSATNEAGNYSRDYEIVQTCGRSINNTAFVKSGGFGIVDIPSPYVAGMDDYVKPQRGRTEHVFVNRFSSPGSPETAGDSNGGPALDPTSAEYSPYNSLNYRNTSVRDPYRLLLSSHINQFGFYSDEFGIGNGPSVVNSLNYIGTGSIYQVNRNTIKQIKDSGSTTITASVHDNYWIQHPIPRTDMQYAWITASALSCDTFGYLPYSGEVSSSSGPISLVTFSSASDYVSIHYQKNPFAGPPAQNFYVFGFNKNSLPVSGTGGSYSFTSSYYIPTVYNWLNYNVYEPLEYSNSFIGYRPSVANISDYVNSALIPDGFTNQDAFDYDAGPAALLNAILLKRNGPYQHPSWKQIRGNENPLVRYWNNHGKTAYMKDMKSSLGITAGDYSPNLNSTSQIRSNPILKVVNDPVIISKYKPLRHGLQIAKEVENENYPSYYSLELTKLMSTYGNYLSKFANREITKDLNLMQDDSETAYRAILDLYTNNALDQSESPVREFGYLSYSEQIYPAPFNCYSKENRERLGYQNTFWKDSRLERTTLGESKFGGDNSQGFARTQSAWALDAAQQFGEPCPATGPSAGDTEGLSSYIAPNYVTGASGELQNDYTFYYGSAAFIPLASSSYLRPAPILSRKQDVLSKYSVVTPTGMESIVTNSTSTVYLTSYENFPTALPVLFPRPYGTLLNRGGNAKFEADKFAGYVEGGVFVSASATPFYDKYEQYNLNMRLKNQDMSLIPEFRIGDHIQKYLTDSNGFVSENTASFSIFGVDSSSAPQNSSEDNFYRIYSFSDFMEYFEVFDEDHKEFDLPQTLTLSCKALMKFIPYDGFYPAERTLEIANAFSQSYASYITCSASGALVNGSVSDPLKLRPIYSPLFSPGILFNTIKSGVAVDYPIYTGSYNTVFYTTGVASPGPPILSDVTGYRALGTGSLSTAGWDYRFNFEKLLNPEEVNNISMMDMEINLFSKLTNALSPSISSSYSILNAPNSPNQYKMMINNFLGEVPNFFLNELVTIKSNKEEEFIFAPETSYGMRIKMYRSMNKERESPLLFSVPQDYPMTGSSLYETITMYSRPTAFGPPVAGSDQVVSGTFQADSTWGLNPSFTPPYYNGESWADIIYNSGPNTGSVTLTEVLASASVNYLRIYPSSQVWPASDPWSLDDFPMMPAHANKFAMQISASVNLFRKDPDNRWTIQTKFETPILNFGDKTKRPLSYENIALPCAEYSDNHPVTAFTAQGLGFGGKTTTPIGMWHQFGLIPEEKGGIYLSVGNIDADFLQHNEFPGTFYPSSLDSLADVVGFEKDARKLGQLRDSKTVYEAIVAIPFREVDNCQKAFFRIPASSKEIAKLEVSLNKYVFPPQFDFVRNSKADKLAMYVFEFDHTFDKNDLSYMWQNLSPKFGTSFKQATATVSHPLLRGEMMDSLKGNVKWVVFKVKQRAETNYYSNIVGSPNIGGTSVASKAVNNSNTELFGYNWPYDYFSMVEFAKIDASVNFGSIMPTDATIKTLPSASQVPLPATYGEDINYTGRRTMEDHLDAETTIETRVKSERIIKKKDLK